MCCERYQELCESLEYCPKSSGAHSFQTARVQESSLSKTQKDDALRFIIHFVGDIHQPLHDEALKVGGNDIDVTWDGDSNNLHHIWGTS